MIKIKNKIGIPKYKQIINSVEQLIVSGELKKGDQIPSINQIKNDHKLSRDTVLMAFNDLKNRGIIQSVVGKGYYVSSDDINITQKIFLLFDELNAFKEDLYNAFLENLGDNVQVDIYFHHFNRNLFSKLIHDNSGDYNYYVIMPANMEDTNLDIQNLPKDRVIVLDQIHNDLLGYSAIYQNFDNALTNNLTKALHLIKKYEKLIFVFNESKQPKGLKNGFVNFCETNNFTFEVIDSLNKKALKRRELYIIPDDKILLTLIKSMKELDYALVDDIGVISYNDTLLKEIVEGGITTISTDFRAMGKRLAEVIQSKEHVEIENPHSLILRNSI